MTPINMKNKYEIDGDTVKIFIKDQVCLIDLDDFELASEHRWLINNGYALTTKKYKGEKQIKIRLHNLIMGGVKNIDHINRNTLDNRKINLRKATYSQNNANRTSSKNKLKGAYKYIDRSSKWFSDVVQNKIHHIKYGFNTEEEAHLDYCKRAKELFGEFACFE